MIKTFVNCYDVNAATCRFFNVYGPNEPSIGEYATVVGKFIRQYENGDPFTVVGDGSQSREFTHVFDICDGLIAAIQNGKLKGEIHDLGRGVAYTILELTKMFQYVNIEYIDKRPGEGQHTPSNYMETARNLDWTASHDLSYYINSVVKQKKLLNI
jgi:UDP-glucose 4-epimerase